uniref:Peptidase S8/S53 domain-containing protein n=1 Tax=Chenopodium quinoa TaxID=63459 RepID=A0A803MWN7_CHEQI
MMAAIDDDVDIINYSQGYSSSSGYFDDAAGIATFHAMKNGILTIAGAGNSGPNPGLLETIIHGSYLLVRLLLIVFFLPMSYSANIKSSRTKLVNIMKAGFQLLFSEVDDKSQHTSLGIKVILEIDHEQIQEDLEDSAKATPCDASPTYKLEAEGSI